MCLSTSVNTTYLFYFVSLVPTMYVFGDRIELPLDAPKTSVLPLDDPKVLKQKTRVRGLGSLVVLIFLMINLHKITRVQFVKTEITPLASSRIICLLSFSFLFKFYLLINIVQRY